MYDRQKQRTLDEARLYEQQRANRLADQQNALIDEQNDLIDIQTIKQEETQILPVLQALYSVII